MLQHEQDRLARARKRTKEAAVASAWRKQAAQSAVVSDDAKKRKRLYACGLILML